MNKWIAIVGFFLIAVILFKSFEIRLKILDVINPQGFVMSYTLANFTGLIFNIIILSIAVVSLIFLVKKTKIKISIQKSKNHTYKKISARFYSVWEKRLLASIIFVAILNLVLWVLLPLSTMPPPYESNFLSSIPSGLLDPYWGILTLWTFSGFLLFLEITFVFALAYTAIWEGEPIAFLIILIIYSIVNIPIILTYNKIPLKRRLVYAYFNSTQISLLSFLIISHAFLLSMYKTI